MQKFWTKVIRKRKLRYKQESKLTEEALGEQMSQLDHPTLDYFQMDPKQVLDQVERWAQLMGALLDVPKSPPVWSERHWKLSM